ncbi:MAG TPA: glycosyltransferase [Candidatus Acidoferrales bacterium]|nr:glycosyltransferase [Candidatus Acidoferrales bacterium]
MSGPRPIRALFVESQTDLGGAQFALLTMLQSLDRARVAPVYASLEFGAGDFAERVEQLGIRVYRLPGGRFRNLWSTAARIGRLHALIREEKIDVVLSNSGHPLFYARPAALLARRPCVWWAHAYFPRDPLRGDVVALTQLFLAADSIFANSEHMARSLRAVYPERPPIRVVRYGIDLARHAPTPQTACAARRELGISPDENVAGIFGRLQRGKGQHVFLEAASLLEKNAARARYLIVGGSVFGLEPEYVAGLRRLVEERGMSERVMFLGQRTDTNELMNACDIVVLASIESETWGLVVAEAMAAGRAVIASAEGGPREMIEDGRTGILVPPGDAAALAAAMDSLFRQPERRCALGRAARLHAEQSFDRFRAAAVLCEALERVCESHARRG